MRPIVLSLSLSLPAVAQTPAWNDYAHLDWSDPDSGFHSSDIILETYTFRQPSDPTEAEVPTYVDPLLQDKLDDFAAGGQDETIQALIYLRDDGTYEASAPMPALEQAVFEGVVTDEAERQVFLQGVMGARRLVVDDLMEATLSQLTPGTYTVLHEGDDLPWMVIEADLSDIQEMVGDDVFASIEEDLADYEDDRALDVIHDELGMERLWEYTSPTSGFKGDYIRVAQLESSCALSDSHPGFCRDSSCASSRHVKMIDCDGWPTYSCKETNSPYTKVHSMMVAGALMGDLMNGQDPSVASADWPVRTGLGPHVVVEGWSTGGLKRRTAWVAALEGILATVGSGEEIQEEIQIVNMSSGTEEVECSGATAVDRAANELVQSGVAFIKSAGNHGDEFEEGECSHNIPAAAVGAFTVGGHENDRETINDGSSFSGYAGGRSIVDVASYWSVNDYYTLAGGYGGSIGGTSMSTPIVTGIAASYQQFYLGVISDRVEDPGVLYTSLLLMGDRRDQTGYMTEGFDDHWGAGAIEARTWSHGGATPDYTVDGTWLSSSLCIEDGVGHRVYLRGGTAVPEGVDHITAVAWWMDRRHEDGHTVNDIDIEVQRRDGSLWVTEGESDSPTDNKERIHVEGDPSDFGGVRWRVNVKGEDIRGTDPFCGAGRQRVYLAVKLEGS